MADAISISFAATLPALVPDNVIFSQEVERVAKKVAFLSTPSIYFSLGDAAIKKESYVFDVRCLSGRRAAKAGAQSAGPPHPSFRSG
jgi:hypothetical protein